MPSLCFRLRGCPCCVILSPGRDFLEFLADFHVHSRYSRATSRDLSLESLHLSALLKGISVVGTGDFTHPGWLREIREKLEPSADGLFRVRADVARGLEKQVPPSCRGEVHFVLSAEVSSIYKKNGQVRKVHNLILVPSLDSAARMCARLEKIGNIASDGRPILGLDSKDLLALALEVSPQAVFIPAHIWTPWFSVLGSRSGFDSIDECFEDLSAEIFALETGLSADPAMCGRLSGLDRYTLVSNSDAHSADKLGREANIFQCELGYPALREAMRSGRGRQFLGTVEFFPEQGKYHLDGHRKCGVRMEPAETLASAGRCRVCGREVTVGVMHRVELLADRPAGERPVGALPYERLISLAEVLAEVHGTGPGSASVRKAAGRLVERLGPELFVLRRAPLEEIERAAGPLVAEAVRRMRAGEVTVEAGYDGEFGVVRLFRQGEIENLSGGGLWAEDTAVPEFGTGEEEREDRAEPAPPLRTRPRPQKNRAPVLQEEQQGSGQDDGFSLGSLFSAAELSRATGGRILERLNPEQREAVLWRGTPLLVVAGPGTGKTLTLACRAAWLVREAGIPPERILAVTFTLKAAREMEERIRALLESEPSGAAGAVWVRTFHALGAELLREDLDWPGLPAGFRILEPSEQQAALKRAEPGLTQSDCADLLERISLEKRRLRYPEDGPPEASDPEFEKLYLAYQKEISSVRGLDFDDLVSVPARALAGSADVRERLQNRFSAILVDEYQDLNFAQYRFLRLLAGATKEVCAIGDPDQAIYGFRGASPEFFRRFLEDWPDGKVVRLVRNYRSSEPVLTAAAKMLEAGSQSGTGRPSRALVPVEPAGPRVRLVETPSEKAEAIFIARTIERLVGGTDSLSFYADRVDQAERFLCGGFGEIAVLFRLAAQSRLIEEALKHQGIPYQSSAQRDTWDTPEGKALLALVRALSAPQDAALRQEALALLGRRAGRVREILGRESQAWGGQGNFLGSGATAPERVSHLRALLALPGERRAGWERAWEALLAVAALEPQADWAGLLRALALSQEADALQPRSEKVTLATLHASKGLEFPVVFIVGCEADLLPLRIGRTASDPEEERRLFYVGMTRARRLLYLVRARSRMIFGKRAEREPSPFLLDLPREKTERVGWTEARDRGKQREPAFEDAQLSLFEGDDRPDRK